MIRYVRHSDIDRLKWDTCVAGCNLPLIYAESWYLDIVSPGWDALIKGDYEAVFPLPHRSKWGFTYVFQPPFCQQLGAFGAQDATPFLDAVPKEFRLIDLQLNSGNTASSGRLKKRPDLLLDLGRPVEVLRRNYSENTIRNIRKAQKNQLSNNPPTDLREVIALFRAYRGKNLRLKEDDYKVLTGICSAATSRGRFALHALRNADGTLMAGAVFVRSQHGWIFLFSAVHPQGRETGAMPALIDGFIGQHAGEQTFLDFEGSSDPNLHRFYKGFGSSETVYLQVRINRLPLPLRWLKS
ncbi:MAG: hypothetical protein RL213_142 [Bacteroidota bacterium]